MTVVAVVQARMGSSRLPGKVMLPLDCKHVLEHVIKRTEATQNVNKTVVATSQKDQDRIIERYASQMGAELYRGSETDVLARMYEAAAEYEADIVVRITADCPLLSPTYIDVAIEQLREGGFDYVASRSEGEFPIGVSSEVFTFESFEDIEAVSTEQAYREHVTPLYYRSHDQFNTYNLDSREVFDTSHLQNRSELRLTLDEADDYELFRHVYDNVPYEEIIPLSDAVEYIDTHGIADINSHVTQKEV